LGRFTLAGRIVFLTIVNVISATLLTFIALRAGRALDMPPLASLAAALLVAVTLAVWSAGRVAAWVTDGLNALADGVRSFRDEDFSLRVRVQGTDEVASLANLYNELADVLRAQRNEIYQKELLLDTILQRTPIAVVLTNAVDRIIYSNVASRELLAAGERIDGRRFKEVVRGVAPQLHEAFAARGDAIVTVPVGDQEETFHLSQRSFHLNTQQHRLILLERLTPELRRQEIAVWKKAIRLINHELNNTIAPVSSLFHSARRVGQMPERRHQLEEIYDTIEERLGVLRTFLESYAQFARLPDPRKERVRWADLLSDVHALYDFTLEGDATEEVLLDRTQMQQVLINLLKNAHESGSDAKAIVVSVQHVADGALLRVADRGRGMDPEVMRQALLPFYSTKTGGTGLGLALCNEIVEAHGGRLHLQAREGGGTIISAWLP
jgi:nitrogen fixation/metabolism regulation signal transduction histidine kinase